MGTDCADVDGNGLPDIFATNFSEELNTLYLNRGHGLFENAKVTAGLGFPGFSRWDWGRRCSTPTMTATSVHVTNGHVIDNAKLYRPNLSYAQKDLLYENQGPSPGLGAGARFRNVSGQGGAALQATRSRRRTAARLGKPTTPPSYVSCNDVSLHFGLGAAKVIRQIEIV